MSDTYSRTRICRVPFAKVVGILKAATEVHQLKNPDVVFNWKDEEGRVLLVESSTGDIDEVCICTLNKRQFEDLMVQALRKSRAMSGTGGCTITYYGPTENGFASMDFTFGNKLTDDRLKLVYSAVSKPVKVQS